ncbi:PREDICTED: protein Lines homolog [Thamnophis sirtalis]|uniref:Protein Lines homolog n=1 Tax=Thamnophis sirtalis TaxID=35019 RepID=A0A6I9XMM8_9SAUR|nr:PREDICTED: protein Lines homolog [Thamnophis sirtalis]
METYFHFLQKTYNDIIAGVLLTQDSYKCAALLNPSVFSSPKNCELCACHFFSKLDAQLSSSLDPINSEHDISTNLSHLKCHAREIILLQLTLIEMMLAKLHLQEVANEIKQKYLKILRILEESNIFSELIHLLRSSDKQLSHMASKSLASLVHFQLREEVSQKRSFGKKKRSCHDFNFTPCRSDDEIQDNRTHQNGYNPHCIFLCLLGSIAFDATVLLDFLISSETCFLEYFVQYLKLLVEDWHWFVQVSKRFKFTIGKDLRICGENLSCQQEDEPNSNLTGQSTAYDPRASTEALLPSSLNLSTLLRQGDSQPQKIDSVTTSSDPHLPGAFQKLVDYDSSDDSEGDCGREECLTDTEDKALNYQACPNKAVLNESAKSCKQGGLPFIEQDLNISSGSSSKLSLPEFKLAGETLQKATACFQQLQKSISRLHAKGLFPYNPNALVKLLNQIHRIGEDPRAASD